MPRSISISIACGAALLVISAVRLAAAQEAHNSEAVVTSSQTFAFTDTKDLVATRAVKAEAVEYKGRKAIHTGFSPGGDAAGLTSLNGTQLSRRDDRSSDLRPVDYTAAGDENAFGFTGLRSAAGPLARSTSFLYAAGTLASGDQAMRNHSGNITSEPAFGLGEAAQYPAVHLRISYASCIWTSGRRRRSKCMAAAPPCIRRVPKSESYCGRPERRRPAGGCRLCGVIREKSPSDFSNLRITPAKPEPIENGGEIAGTWEVKCATDAGGFGGTMKLVREGSTLVGIWSGALGPDQPVNGVWRDGYVELSFSGTWPEQPGAVTATFDGWVDGDSAKGRMKVEGRAMGRWTAERKK